LVSLVMFPDLPDAREGFVLVMKDVLPAGLLGLLFAAFIAAFTSTFAAHLNWGTSYLINDFWRRFIKPDQTEKHYVLVSRIVTFVLAIIAFLVTTQLDSIKQAWGLVITASAGLGTVLILRWYWWRINAWSELAATLAPIAMVVLVLFGVPIPGITEEFPINLFTVVVITTVVWVIATFITPATNDRTLDKFFRRVRPGGPGWKVVAARNSDVQPDSKLLPLALDWIAGVVLVYMVLFGFGYLLLGEYINAAMCLGLATFSGWFIWFDLNKRGFDSVMDQ